MDMTNKKFLYSSTSYEAIRTLCDLLKYNIIRASNRTELEEKLRTTRLLHTYTRHDFEDSTRVLRVGKYPVDVKDTVAVAIKLNLLICKHGEAPRLDMHRYSRFDRDNYFTWVYEGDWFLVREFVEYIMDRAERYITSRLWHIKSSIIDEFHRSNEDRIREFSKSNEGISDTSWYIRGLVNWLMSCKVLYVLSRTKKQGRYENRYGVDMRRLNYLIDGEYEVTIEPETPEPDISKIIRNSIPLTSEPRVLGISSGNLRVNLDKDIMRFYRYFDESRVHTTTRKNRGCMAWLYKKPYRVKEGRDDIWYSVLIITTPMWMMTDRYKEIADIPE